MIIRVLRGKSTIKVFFLNKTKNSGKEDAIQSGQTKIIKSSKKAPLVDEIESESEKKSPVTRRNKSTEEVWNCFEKFSHEPNRKKHLCLLCGKNGLKVVIYKFYIQSVFKRLPNRDKCCELILYLFIKIISGTSSNEAGLRKHLASFHGKLHVLFESQKKAFKQQKFSAQEKKLLHAACTKAIIVDGLPFGLMRKKGMGEMLNCFKPGYVGPHPSTTVRHLKSAYYSQRAEFRTMLQSILNLALTCDLWKSNSLNHHICITAHFFNQNYEYVSAVLGFRHVTGQHTSKNLENYINFELKQLDIDQSKIVATTTDNAADIKKAAANFGTRIACLCHLNNLIVQNGLQLWSNKK